MNDIAVLGTLVDVTGFALAGIDGVVCTTANEVKSALAVVATSPTTGVVLVSPECAALARDEIEAFRRGHEMPMVVVLPGRTDPTARAPVKGDQ